MATKFRITCIIVCLWLTKYDLVLALSFSQLDNKNNHNNNHKSLEQPTFPNSIPVQHDDILTLQRQTGQIAPGKAAIGIPDCCRCQHGYPQAFAMDPMPEQRINSGLVKLTCPLLVRAMDEMEDEGYIQTFTDTVESNPALHMAVHDSHLIHANIRKEMIRQKGNHATDSLKQQLGDQGADAFLNSGIAGSSPDKTDVKCLHAWLGDYLFRKESTLGKVIAKTLVEKKDVSLSGTIDCHQLCNPKSKVLVEPPKPRNKQRLKTRKERDRRKRLKNKQQCNEPQEEKNIWNNKIIACSSTKELKEAIQLCVKSNHIVAELGAQLRDVSTQIVQNCQQAVLVDVTRKFPKEKKTKETRTTAMRLDSSELFHPEKATFVEIPKLEDWKQAFFPMNNDSHYDVLVLDVNGIVGNDLEWTALSLIQQFQSQQQGKDLLILVKSLGLSQISARLMYGKNYENYKNTIPPPHILATVGVQEYRSTIPHVVQQDDAVLEVGCHFGTTTAMLDEKADYCIGVDVGSKIITAAQAKHPNTYFRVGDAWKTAALLRIQQDFFLKCAQGNHSLSSLNRRPIGFDVVYVDVGGLSGGDGLLEAILLVTSIRHALEPRCIVIKSLCMQRLSNKLVSFWSLKKRAKDS